MVNQGVLWTIVLAASFTLACGSWAVYAAVTSPVGERPLVTFARRQRLDRLTAHPDVLAYLALRRRWRISGMVAALFFALGAGARSGRIFIDLGAAFLGWFTGALVAEWRFNVRRDAGRRAAMLTRRTLRGHLGLASTVVPILALTVLVVFGIVDLLSAPFRPTITIVLTGLAHATAAGLTARHILVRPASTATEGVSEKEAAAIDHALRARSLHALSGAVTAYAIAGVAGLVLISPRLNPTGAQLRPFLLVLAAAAVGWLVGVARGPAA